MANIGTASVYTSVTATGTTQDDAYEIVADKTYFSTVASGSGAVLDSDASYGDSRTIYNGGANDLKVYPSTDTQINSLGLNQHILLPVKTTCVFVRLSDVLWTGVLSR